MGRPTWRRLAPPCSGALVWCGLVWGQGAVVLGKVGLGGAVWVSSRRQGVLVLAQARVLGGWVGACVWGGGFNRCVWSFLEKKLNMQHIFAPPVPQTPLRSLPGPHTPAQTHTAHPPTGPAHPLAPRGAERRSSFASCWTGCQQPRWPCWACCRAAISLGTPTPSPAPSPPPSSVSTRASGARNSQTVFHRFALFASSRSFKSIWIFACCARDCLPVLGWS